MGRSELNMDVGSAESVAKPGNEEDFVKTPWLKIDDAFYEARGATWALTQLMRAAEVDFAEVLRKKNCLLYTSPSPRDLSTSRMPSSA